MMQSPETAAQALVGADAVLLGGASLAGMGERLRAMMNVPVWDCVELAQWRWAQYQMGNA